MLNESIYGYETNKNISVTFKGYATENFTNGTYTGSYSSTITSSITAGNDSSNLLIVKVDGEVLGKIGKGFMVLIGVSNSDTKEIADKMVKKLVGLRIFEDENGNVKHVMYHPNYIKYMEWIHQLVVCALACHLFSCWRQKGSKEPSKG